MAPRGAFGLFGTNDPGFGNLHQYNTIFFGYAARQPAAFRSVVAKFLRIDFIVIFHINFHFEFRIITIDFSALLRKIGFVAESSRSNFRAGWNRFWICELDSL